MGGEAACSPAMASDPDVVLGRLARARDGVFTRADALAAGLSPGEIRRRVRTGLWVPMYGGALRASTTPETPDARERAGLARAGAGAVLSHFSAARRWRLGVADSAETWVSVSHDRTVRPTRGLHVVRTRHLPAASVVRVGGLPVTSAARTIADLAGHLDERALTAVALEAMQRRLCTHDEILACHVLLGRRRGAALLARVVERADPALESILAAEFGELTGRAQLHLVPGHRLRLPDGTTVICDFADPRARIDFEVDGFAYHGSPEQVRSDKARDRRVLRAGWITVRYDTDDVRRRPTETLADVLHQIAQRRR